MKLRLVRSVFKPEGIFGNLYDEVGNHIAASLEHAYSQTDATWAAKLYDGEFTCVRGKHRLHNMKADFETFEIEGVKGHDNILFHSGNYNKDSEGCVLLGEDNAGYMITNSRVAFKKFMDLLIGVDQFTLVVE